MSKKTTVKTAMLNYRAVGGTGDYKKVSGVLKGMAIAQDEPDSNEIQAEFFDAPFDIIYTGKPVKFTFELANYDLKDLPDLFGGSYDDATDTYEGPSSAFTSEHEWQLEFQRGNYALMLYRGLTVGTIKKDADGSLNYSVTITALNWTDTNDVEHMYKIVGGSTVEFKEVTSPSGNPKSQGYFESDGAKYRLTWDTEVVDGKTYYRKV
jgi:hypothetical protein